MDFVVAAVTAFALVLPVELPDKTFVATLVLATRYRPRSVWFGVVLAFGVQCLVAVTLGRVIGLLPADPVHLFVAALFLVGAVLLIRAARRPIDTDPVVEEEERYARRVGSGRRTRRRAVVTSFLVLFMAEWGDLSQLLTAGLVARDGQPAAVFVGAWSALAVVSGLAVVLGRVLLRYVRLAVVQYVGAGVCVLLGALTIVDVAT